jgi:hypothetical protein
VAEKELNSLPEAESASAHFFYMALWEQRLLISSFMPLGSWKPIKSRNYVVSTFSPEKLEEK